MLFDISCIISFSIFVHKLEVSISFIPFSARFRCSNQTLPLVELARGNYQYYIPITDDPVLKHYKREETISTSLVSNFYWSDSSQNFFSYLQYFSYLPYSIVIGYLASLADDFRWFPI